MRRWEEMEKRVSALLLAAALALAGAVPAWGQVPGRVLLSGASEPLHASPALAADETDAQLGDLSVFTRDGGGQKVRAALDAEERVLAEPETIAALADASLSVEGSQYNFQRSSYVVSVDAKTGQVATGLLPVGWKLYGDQEFVLEGIRTLPVPGEEPGDAEEEALFFPLEQMLYLLQVQWFCSQGCVYCFAPEETLWDIVADLSSLYQNQPTYGEIFCTQEGSFNSKGYYFAILALADDIDWKVCVEYFYNLDRVEEALLTLAIPCENLSGALQTKAEAAADPYVGALMEMSQEFGTLGGGIVSTLDALATSFTAWKDYKMPDYMGPAMDGFSTAVGLLSALQTSVRYLEWTEGYVEQLGMLAELDHPSYEEDCKLVRASAQGLLSEYGNPAGNFLWEGAQSLAFSAADIAMGKTPAGIIFNALKASVVVAKQINPQVASLLAAGDSVSIAKRLCDVSVLLRAVYADQILRVIRDHGRSLETLQELCDTGKLLASVNAHSLDALYSAAFSLARKEDPSITEEEAMAWEESGYSMGAIGGKLIASQTFALRFQEAEQYLPSLLLYEDFSNLYSTESGACRQKIPPEYVIPRQVENNGGNVVGYQGCLYYWKYNEASYSSPANYASYYPLTNIANQLVCRQADGSEEVLLTSQGAGPIFIAGERIYLQAGGQLYSVALDGSDRVEHGAFELWAADLETGMLWGTSYERGGGVFRISSEDHQITQLMDRGDIFLGSFDGYYYFGASSYGDTASATLLAAASDGSEIRELDTVSGPPEAMSLNLMELSRLGDTLYYSYGFYAGTGGFFQGGGIRAVGVDGSNPRDCVDYGQMQAEEFLVEEQDGQTFLYYIGTGGTMGSYIGFWDDYPYRSCMVKNLDTGENKSSDYALSRPGSFVCMGGGIYRIQENSRTYQTILTPEAAASFGFVDYPQGTEETLVLISSLDVVGEDYVFTVDWSRRDSSSDMGWRPGYTRERSTVYLLDAESGELVELYSY